MIIRDKKEFSDPLSETGIPDICQKFNWNHHSPSQGAYPDGNFAYRYWFVPQEVRRQFEGNANMAAGVAIGSSIQYHLADKIFKLNPNTRKLSPVVNSRLSILNIKFSKYCFSFFSIKYKIT